MRGTDCRLWSASMETSGIENIDMENANMATPPAISPCYRDYDSKQTYVSCYFSSNNSWNIYSWNKQRSVLKANSQMRIELTISGMATWMKWNKYRSVLKSNYSGKSNVSRTHDLPDASWVLYHRAMGDSWWALLTLLSLRSFRTCVTLVPSYMALYTTSPP